jgi:hypothetical protein
VLSLLLASGVAFAERAGRHHVARIRCLEYRRRTFVAVALGPRAGEALGDFWRRADVAAEQARDWGSLLRVRSQVAESADRRLELAVVQARAAGMTWDDIGDALRLTRGAVHSRYRRLEV